MTATPRAHLPPRLLPILYFGAAHVALALAFGAVAVDPGGASGFFYNTRMLGVVHLITLGWITASIFGSLYIVGPVALRVWIPSTWPDYAGAVLILVGVAGMVAHFWMRDYAGMSWSAGAVLAGITTAGVHLVRCLSTAAVPRAVIAHVVLAFLNLLGAATMGVLMGFDKAHHFLPGAVLANVFAHAHLAAVGWASMMVIGVAYRLLPMVLPAAMPTGSRPWVSAVLLQAGVSGLFVALVFRSPLVWIPAIAILAGFAAFISQVAWMLRRPRPRPPRLPRPDLAVWHAGASFVSLVIASVLGMWLAVAEPSLSTQRIALAYGVFGLIGFLAQMVVGMEGRVLPMFAWYWANAITGYKGAVLPQHEMNWRQGQFLVFALWLFGVPALGGGLAFEAIPLVRAAAWCLFVATLIDSVNAARIFRYAIWTPPPAHS